MTFLSRESLIGKINVCSRWITSYDVSNKDSRIFLKWSDDDDEARCKMLHKRLKWMHDPVIFIFGDGVDNNKFSSPSS